jgi:amidase
MTGQRVSAFTDDALGDHDAVGLAALVARGQVSPEELAAAAIARARSVEDRLQATAFTIYDDPRVPDDPSGALFGVPTYVKDNTDVRGLPSNHGSEAFVAHPAKRDAAYTRQYLSTGMTLLGKSRLPEFGFSASTEFMTQEPTHNPWNTDYSSGASSGGAAALVASGVVPIAHANDGGGSIRIPAACTGLVGLKSTRHRLIDGDQTRHLPVNMAVEGVVTRTVRDTAVFFAAQERYYRNPALPPIGLVEGPANRRLHVGLILETVNDAPIDAQTVAAVERTAALLEKAGHVVEPIPVPVGQQFADDFLQYWGLLAFLASATGKVTFDRSFDLRRCDGLTKGLRAFHTRNAWRTPGAIRRLRRGVAEAYAQMFAQHELVLSPTLAHVTPKLGHLSPTLPFDVLIERLKRYVAFPPLNNIAGTPAISLPMAVAEEGVPIGIQLHAAHGDERTLIETAFLLEQEQPFPRIQDRALAAPA